MEDKKDFTGAFFSVFFNGPTRSQIPGTAKHANRKDRRCTKWHLQGNKKGVRDKNSPFKTVQKKNRRGLRRRLKTFFSGHKTKPMQPKKNAENCQKMDANLEGKKDTNRKEYKKMQASNKKCKMAPNAN